MTVLKFADSFWDKEWTGVSGFEALTKRMKVGRETCKDLVAYFKERANIEKDYSTKLQKLAKSMEKKSHNTDESESLDEAISKLILEAENIAGLHTSCAQVYAERVDKLSKFHEYQKEEKKKVEESLKKSQGQKISQYNKTMSALKNYHSKCRERDQLKTQLDSCQQAVTVAQTKDCERTKGKLDKAETSMQQADSAYKTAVENLEKLRVSWEKDMIESCNKFQELDEERISVLRNELWLHCNIMSQICVDVDKCCEVTRIQLEKCSIEKDIADFIQSCKTGEERPGKIEYENYHTGSPTKKTPTPKMGQRVTEAPVKPSRHQVLPQVPARPTDFHQVTGNHGNHTSPTKKAFTDRLWDFRSGPNRRRLPEVIGEGDYAAIDDSDCNSPVPVSAEK